MADALVSVVLDRLASIAEREVRLVRSVKKEIQSLTGTLRAINSVLKDAERKQKTEENVRLWLENLKDASYDIDDVLDEWSTTNLQLRINEQLPEYAPVPKKVCSNFLLPCITFKQLGMHRKVSLQIKDVRERLDMIAKDKESYNFTVLGANQEHERPPTTSSIDVSRVYGRDDSKKTLIRKLCDSSQEESSLPVFAIVGMGGIGKTTLAQLVYEDNEVKKQFEKAVWVCVSQPFDEIGIAKAIIATVNGQPTAFADFENILRHMRESIVGKRFLLVLDDVWTEDYKKWEQLRDSLKRGAQGSRILVTTRSERVGMMMETTYMMRLGEMSNEDCWLIFSQIALNGRTREECGKLEEIGRRLVLRCKGLPLAAKVLGGLMRFKRSKEDWQTVLDSDLWDLEEARRDIIIPLWLSYYDLPSAIKRCFSYCATFPKDSLIVVERLIKLWMANGFLNSELGTEMKALGQEYFEILALRSLFQDFAKDSNGGIFGCKMHDIVHDCAQLLTRNECRATEVSPTGRMDSTHGKLRHVTVSEGVVDELLSRKNVNTIGLHTLLLGNVSSSGLFGHCTRLRALEMSLSWLKFSELNHLGKLIHLRYLVLDLFDAIKELPETVCDLCNLQTLKIINGNLLEKLPRGIEKLVNLRHLIIPNSFHLRSMPKGISELRSLRTLERFIVSCKNDTGDGCAIGDLEKLNCLRGVLRIRWIGEVGDPGEAERAKLKEKTNLRRLELLFEGSREAEEAGARRQFLTMEALEPPPHLESLEIWHYGGTELPNWIALLPNLKQLELFDCPNMKAISVNLQALLPLQQLKVSGCPKLEALPQDLEALRELWIDRCPILEQRCSMETGDIWALISHIPNIAVGGRFLRNQRQH